MPHLLTNTTETAVAAQAGLLDLGAVRQRAVRRRRRDLLALMLLLTSACGSVGGIALWVAGDGALGLRVLAGSVLAILGVLLV